MRISFVTLFEFVICIMSCIAGSLVIICKLQPKSVANGLQPKSVAKFDGLQIYNKLWSKQNGLRPKSITTMISFVRTTVSLCFVIFWICLIRSSCIPSAYALDCINLLIIYSIYYAMFCNSLLPILDILGTNSVNGDTITEAIVGNENEMQEPRSNRRNWGALHN